MLAGLPKAPSAYNPIANPKRATLRQRYIINRMFENGFITEAQHEEALAQTLDVLIATPPRGHLSIRCLFCARDSRILGGLRFRALSLNRFRR